MKSFGHSSGRFLYKITSGVVTLTHLIRRAGHSSVSFSSEEMLHGVGGGGGGGRLQSSLKSPPMEGTKMVGTMISLEQVRVFVLEKTKFGNVNGGEPENRT